MNRRKHQFAAGIETGTGDLFVPGPDGDFIDTAHAGFARLAKAARHAGEVLQFEGNVFEDVRRPGSFVEPAQESAAFAVAAAMLDQRGQEALEPLDKTGDGVGRKVFQLANIDDGFDDRTIGPDVRTAQIADFEKLDVFRIHWLNIG